jgi:Ca2+/Na+ antiporter
VITNNIVAGMVGIMLFFSVVVAPTVFKVLPMEWSSKYVRNFFPKYYLSLGILSLLAAIFSPNRLNLIILLIAAASFLFLLLYLTRQINFAKDNGHEKRFHLLHGLSVIINLGQISAFIYLLITSGN